MLIYGFWYIERLLDAFQLTLELSDGGVALGLHDVLQLVGDSFETLGSLFTQLRPHL